MKVTVFPTLLKNTFKYLITYRSITYIAIATTMRNDVAATKLMSRINKFQHRITCFEF